MIYIKQTPTGAKAHFEGDFPDLVCDLVIAYKIVEMRGLSLGVSVPRLVDLISDSEYIEQLAKRYEEQHSPYR